MTPGEQEFIELPLPGIYSGHYVTNALVNYTGRIADIEYGRGVANCKYFKTSVQSPNTFFTNMPYAGFIMRVLTTLVVFIFGRQFFTNARKQAKQN